MILANSLYLQAEWENSVDPDQLKPADQDPHCFPTLKPADLDLHYFQNKTYPEIAVSMVRINLRIKSIQTKPFENICSTGV